MQKHAPTPITMPPAKIGKGLSVQFSLGPGGIQCEWDPAVPDQPLPRQMRRRYEEAQQLFVKHLAETLGGPTAIANDEAVAVAVVKPREEVAH